MSLSHVKNLSAKGIARKTIKSSSKASFKPAPIPKDEPAAFCRRQETRLKKRQHQYSVAKDEAKACLGFRNEKLWRSEEQLRIEQSDFGFGSFTCDRDWRFISVNLKAERLLGIPCEEVLGRSHWEVFPLTLGTRLESEYRRAAAGEVRDFENFYEPWGRWFHIRCLPRSGGGISVYFHRISKLKHAEAALKESEERYRCLVESTDDSIYLVDEACNYLFINRKHRKRLGASSTKVEGTAYGTYHTRQETDAFREKVKTVFETGRPVSYEYQSERDGNYFVRTLSPIMDGEKVKTVSVVSKDITRQKQAELQAQIDRLELEHLERLAIMGELTASIAHELNQPLTAIFSNAQAALHLIRCNPPDTDEVYAILEDIIADNRRAGQFIKNLRTLFKKDEIHKDSLDINGLIEAVLHLFKSEAILREITIETALDRRLPRVLGNDIQLQQVILNLMLNASESMVNVNDRPRYIFLSTVMENKSYLKIVIRDSGVGIAPEKQKFLFKHYFTTKKDGMGMGLSICRSIIEAHEGRIWAESNPDQGSTFCFILPVNDEAK